MKTLSSNAEFDVSDVSVLSYEVDRMSWSAKWILTDSDFSSAHLTQKGNCSELFSFL